MENPSSSSTSAMIFGAGVASMFALLLHATLAEGTPLHQLGKRPMGRGLWGYLWNGTLTNSIGTVGYDPVLGAFAPVTRLLLHWSLILMLWGMTGFFILPSNNDSDIDALWTIGLAVSVVYGITCHVIHHCLPGVSIPGGPRPHKIQRYPKWTPGIRSLSSEDALVYDHGQTSHEWTHQERFAQVPNFQLTGEPAGRDIWKNKTSTKTNKSRKQRWVDERLVKEWASGGRPWGFDPSVNPNSADQLFRAQMIRQHWQRHGPPKVNTKKNNKSTNKIDDALYKAIRFYSMLQTDDGHWSGDYGGPLFLMPGLIVVWYCMGKPAKMLSETEQQLMKEYIINHQQADGGWGTHIESPSTMFGTTLNYVSLRLLGMPADDPICQQGRQFIQDQGGALYTSSWAKFYLCLLGCMEWEGHNSVPPEMWLLPNWVPFHPGRMWCHARMVYLPMGYLYGSRYVYGQADTDPVVQALRKELYAPDTNYDAISWMRTRHYVAPMDNYSPIPWTMEVIQNALARYENWSIFQPFKNWVRKRGLSFSVEYMSAEDLQTNFIDIGPVNKVLNMLSAYHAAGESLDHSTVVNHMARVSDYLWLAEDGLKMKGYNGSQSWDTSFAMQAIHESGLVDEFPEMSTKVWSYLERTQILSTEVSQATAAFEFESDAGRKQCYRHTSLGGWPFKKKKTEIYLKAYLPPGQCPEGERPAWPLEAKAYLLFLKK